MAVAVQGPDRIADPAVAEGRRTGRLWWGGLAFATMLVALAGVAGLHTDGERMLLLMVFTWAALAIPVGMVAGIVAAIRGRPNFAVRSISFAFAMLLANVLTAATISLDAQWQHRAADRLAVHLEEYRGMYGDYPSQLDDLVPETMAEIPWSPVDLLNGRKLYYYRIGNSFVLRIYEGEWMHTCRDQNGWMTEDQCWETCW